MKRSPLIAIFISTFCILQACHNIANDGSKTSDSTTVVHDASGTKDSSAANPSDTSQNPAAAAIPDTARTKMVYDSPNINDNEFAVGAINGYLTEISLSKLAEQQSQNSQVKYYAKMMVDSHTRANVQLTILARSKAITIPDAPNDKTQKMLTDLSKKSGRDFDRAYIDAMIGDHQNTVKLFNKEIQMAGDSDIKAFAVENLPMVKGHLSGIKVIQTHVR